MTKRIRVGIIGANPDRGWAAQAHIPALKSLPDDFEITALSTSRRESADAASRRFGVPLAFDNTQDLVTRADVDEVLGVIERRSEEHTSELQSRLHLVCRLLLEKKKKTHASYPASI